MTAMKSLVRRAVRSVGYDIVRAAQPAQLAQLAPDVPHSQIAINSTYSPWLADREFMSFYRAIQTHTLVDLYRCYELWTLTAQAAQLPGAMIEIGVWRGGTGALIAHRAAQREVYLCDTFAGVVGAGERDTRYKGGEHADTSIEIVRDLLARLDIHNTRLLTGIFPEETAKDCEGSLSLVHIDVDVYESAQSCFEWAWPRLLPGGIIVFDDYGFHGCEGITRMVNDIDEPNGIMIYNLNGHAIVTKSSSK